MFLPRKTPLLRKLSLLRETLLLKKTSLLRTPLIIRQNLRIIPFVDRVLKTGPILLRILVVTKKKKTRFWNHIVDCQREYVKWSASNFDKFMLTLSQNPLPTIAQTKLMLHPVFDEDETLQPFLNENRQRNQVMAKLQLDLV